MDNPDFTEETKTVRVRLNTLREIVEKLDV